MNMWLHTNLEAQDNCRKLRQASAEARALPGDAVEKWRAVLHKFAAE